MAKPNQSRRFGVRPAIPRSRARRNTPLYRLKAPSQKVAMVLSALAEGLDPSAAERVFGYRQATITRWLTRAARARAHPERTLLLPSLAPARPTGPLLQTRLRSHTQVQWLWLAIDPRTKLLPVLGLGPRTQHMAHQVIHSLRRFLAPDCLPLFTSDGLHLYFYALTAHFGHWREVSRRGRHGLRWQVAAGLIYGQVKQCYRQRKLLQVTHVMRLGTEAALTATLQRLGFSGRLNTAFIERVNLTVRDARGCVGPPDLGNDSTVPTAASQFGMVARRLTFCASERCTASSTQAASRTRWQTSSATLPTPYSSYGCRQYPSTMDNSGGAHLPIDADLHLRDAKARLGWGVRSWRVWRRCSQKHANAALLREEMASLDCLLTAYRPQIVLERGGRFIHHI